MHCHSSSSSRRSGSDLVWSCMVPLVSERVQAWTGKGMSSAPRPASVPCRVTCDFFLLRRFRTKLLCDGKLGRHSAHVAGRDVPRWHSPTRTSLGSPPRCSHGIPDESFEMQDWKLSKSFVLGSWQTIVLPILPFSPHATDACHFLASLWSKWRMFRGNHAGELEVSTNTNVWYF